MMQRMLSIVLLMCIALLLYLLAFQVGNTDFWWHVKAGQLMRASGWIHTDPFAYTRIGQPYLAVHEWLSQITVSLIYDHFGWQGITFLRVFLVGIAFSLPLLLWRQSLHIGAVLALFAAASARPGLTDRPQLFTLLCFSVVLTLCVLYLDADAGKRRRILYAFPCVILLWSNLHGAASITGLALVAALFASSVSLPLFLSLCASCIALLLTPSGTENVYYLLSLFSDQSASLIAEWQPSLWKTYLLQTGAVWVAAVTALVAVRRHMVFSVLILLGIGYLSRTAARHEALLLLTLLGVIILQVRFLRIRVPLVVLAFCTVLTAGWTVVQAHRYTVRDDTFGFGEFTPMQAVAAYLKTHNTGPVFNTYNAGGELLYEGIPVFLDGRNIDYGYAYIRRAIDAGTDASIWNALQSEYGFTAVVIFYKLVMQRSPVPYIDLLQNDPEWHLTYLDDWAAVYKKETADAEESEEADEYTLLTPTMLYRTQMPEEITLGNLQLLEQEVLRTSGKRAAAYHAEMLRAFGA